MARTNGTQKTPSAMEKGQEQREGKTVGDLGTKKAKKIISFNDCGPRTVSASTWTHADGHCVE